MAFKKKSPIEAETKKSSADYYKLNTKAIDDLVTADESNSPEMTPEDLRKYGSQSKFRMPEWLKAVLIKLWFAGAVCFFVFWGLGNYIAGLDMMFVFAVALGIVTDLLTNNVFRFCEKKPGLNDKWMMLPKKNFINFFLNIIYAGILLAAVYFIYNILNAAVISVTGADESTVPVPVEPILFGVFYMGVDMLFLGMKHTFEKIVDDAEKKVKKESIGKK